MDTDARRPGPRRLADLRPPRRAPSLRVSLLHLPNAHASETGWEFPVVARGLPGVLFGQSLLTAPLAIAVGLFTGLVPATGALFHPEKTAVGLGYLARVERLYAQGRGDLVEVGIVAAIVISALISALPAGTVGGPLRPICPEVLLSLPVSRERWCSGSWRRSPPGCCW